MITEDTEIVIRIITDHTTVTDRGVMIIGITEDITTIIGIMIAIIKKNVQAALSPVHLPGVKNEQLRSKVNRIKRSVVKIVYWAKAIRRTYFTCAASTCWCYKY